MSGVQNQDLSLKRQQGSETLNENEVVPAEDSTQENTERGNWTGKFDFILSCIGYSVGLGNVWRFPYLTYSNGGGAFLIPYLCMLIICGLPLYYFELAFGQFSNLGPVTIWRVMPIFKGVGYSMIIISFLVALYYNVIIAWALYYLFASMQPKVPWSDCERKWNDLRCKNAFAGILPGGNVPGNPKHNPFPLPCTNTLKVNCTYFQTAAEQYFEREVLGMTLWNGTTLTMMDDLGNPQWHLSLCLLLAWIFVFACLVGGVQVSGKVVYFTVLFPYAVMIIFTIYAATLPNALDGVKYYLIPDFNKVLNAKVWGQAATQIFYSLGISFGSLIAMASFNKFKNNCYRDALVVAFLNCGTSIFAGFSVFSVLGWLSAKTEVPIGDVVTGGPGLVFVVFPEAISNMPVSQLWSILFFVMILTLGLDSQFAMVEVIFTGLHDELRPFLKTKKRAIIFKLFTCIFMFLLGIPMVCKGGIFWFKLVEWRSAGLQLFVIAILEILAVVYFYGIKNFLRDISMMLGFLPGAYWIGCWMIVSPVVMAFLFISNIVQYSRISYGKYVFPLLAEVLGWLMIILCLIMIPVCAVRHGVSSNWSLKPSLKWGPAVEKFWTEDSRYAKKLTILKEQERKEEEFKQARIAAGLYMGLDKRKVSAF